jgi:peptidoglycan/xylan/chitin deacetylase (PgdA/CDA1 family)
VIKGVVEAALAALLGNRVAMQRLRGRRLILAYHNIIPTGSAPVGDRSLHLPLAEFAAQLDVVQEHADVVSLEALNEAPSREPLRPQVIITFDDAYAGAMSLGIPELVRRGLPATVFVAPALLEQRAFWWDRLANPTTGELDARIRHTALERYAGHDEAIMTWAAQQRLPVCDPPAIARGATLADLADAAALPGITFGAHSWSHPNMARVSGAELVAQLRDPFTWLAERFASRTLAALAYPYGLFLPETESAARAAGFRYTLQVHGGWCTAHANPQQPLPRLNVPAGMSTPRFRLHLAGFAL